MQDTFRSIQFKWSKAVCLDQLRNGAQRVMCSRFHEIFIELTDNIDKNYIDLKLNWSGRTLSN